MKQHILVVDDETPVLELLSAYFKKYGYDVSTAISADDALRLIDEQSIHIVLLDVLLADTDGLDVLAQIKAARPQLPVMLMTGLGFEEQLLHEALEKGAAGFVSKTLPLDQLLAEAQRILNYKP